MNFFIVVLFACLFIFLYVLYFLSHDDFVILRNDVSMEKIFNTAFIFSAVSLFSSRLIYVIGDPQEVFFSPLGFLLFPYFPGLSLAGGILGGFAFLIVYLILKGFPVGRILDFFAVGFLVASPIGFLGYILLSGGNITYNAIISLLLNILLLGAFLKFLLPISLSGKLKDGSLGILFLISFSGIFFTINLILNNGFIFSLDNFILLGISIALTIPLLRQEGYEWYQNYLRRR
jgi:hypothetical protein